MNLHYSYLDVNALPATANVNPVMAVRGPRLANATAILLHSRVDDLSIEFSRVKPVINQ